MQFLFPQLSRKSHLDLLREFMEQSVDLQQWAQIGVQVGMEPLSKPVKKFHPYGLENLLQTLQVVGISSIAEYKNALSDLEQMTDHLQRFVAIVKSKGKTVYAVPVDVLILLISFSKAAAIPSDFNWGGKYDAFFIESLRETLQQVCPL